jgi:hypothetical protein
MVPEYENVVKVLGFRPAETKTTDPLELERQLVGKRVLVIPEQQETSEEALERLGAAVASKLRAFLTSGGRIVGMSYALGAEDILRGAEIWSCSNDVNLTGDDLAVAQPSHPLAKGVSESFKGPDGSTDFKHVPSGGATVIVWDPWDRAPVVFEWTTGGGTIVMLGFDYFAYNEATATLLRNAVTPLPPPGPCPICDGGVYSYGVWRLQYDSKEKDMYIVSAGGDLAFRIRWDSNGWFYFIERGVPGIAWSTGQTSDPLMDFRIPVATILETPPVGAVPESPFTMGEWEFVFRASRLTIANAKDVGVESYQGLILEKGEAVATFQGRRSVRTFSIGCPVLLATISVSGVESILDSLGLVYTRLDVKGTPVWFFKLDGNAVALFPFLPAPTGAYWGLQLLYVATATPRTSDQVYRWNVEKRGSRAYIDDDGTPVLEAEIFLDGGVTRDGVIAFILRFSRSVREFKDFLTKK